MQVKTILRPNRVLADGSNFLNLFFYGYTRPNSVITERCTCVVSDENPRKVLEADIDFLFYSTAPFRQRKTSRKNRVKTYFLKRQLEKTRIDLSSRHRTAVFSPPIVGDWELRSGKQFSPKNNVGDWLYCSDHCVVIQNIIDVFIKSVYGVWDLRLHSDSFPNCVQCHFTVVWVHSLPSHVLCKKWKKKINTRINNKIFKLR